MSVLTANLKHIYQNRSCLWQMIFVTAVAGLIDFVLMVCGDLNKISWHIPALCWMSTLAFSLSALRVDIMTKDFSYCMPGSKGLAWKVLLAFGVAGAILWSLKSVVVMLIYGFLNPSAIMSMTLVMILLAQVSYYMMLFWLNAWLGTKINLIAGVGLVVFEMFMLNKFKIEPYTMQAGQQVIVALVGLVVTYMSWSYWSRSGLAKDYIGKVWICSLADTSQRQIGKIQRAKAEKEYENKSNQIEGISRAEEYYMGKISTAEPGSRWQYIWGSIYCHLGPLMPEKKIISLIIFLVWGALLGVTSYSSDISGFWLLFPFMIQMPNILMKNDYSITGILCGRENVYRSMISVVFYCYRAMLVVITIAIIFAVVSKLLLPEIEIGGVCKINCVNGHRDVNLYER